MKGVDPRRNITGTKSRLIDGKSVPALCREYGPEAIATCVRIMTDPKARDRDRLAAAHEILDRGYGKAETTLKIEGQIDHNHITATVDFSQLSVEALRQLMAARVDAEPNLIESQWEPDDE